LGSIYSSRNALTQLVEDLLTCLIDNSDDPDEILRVDSVASDLFEYYMKSTCYQYLHYILQDFLIHVITTNLSCELCPSLLKENDSLLDNLAHLRGYLLMLLDNVTKSADMIPFSARYIFSKIQENAVKKFSNPEIKYSLVSCFLFLRFINPALISPLSYCLLSTQPPIQVLRTTTFLAKTLQIITGLSHSIKEDYMLALSGFIEEHREEMKSFVEKVCTVPSKISVKGQQKTRKKGTDLKEHRKSKKLTDFIRSAETNSETSTPEVCNRHLPRLLVIDCGEENLFCEQAAYLYRYFSKEYERILPSITDKNMETDFHKIMNKIQTQIEKVESTTIPERNTVSAPTTTRLLTPITNNIISSKGKPKRTSIKYRVG